MSEPIQVFYSYSHKDEELRNVLETHLSVLKRQGVILDWHDRKIMPSETWEEEIDLHIDNADVVLILVSPDFFASDYCYGRELSRVLERREAGKTLVVPIILRPVDWTGEPLGKFQALPKDGKPITTWANQDEAWLDVSKGLRKLINKIPSPKRSTDSGSGPVAAIELIREEFVRLEERYGRPSGIGGASTGLHTLDQIMDGIHKTDIVLICGRPSMGKSDLALNIALKLTKETSLPVLFVSMRIARDQMARRLFAAESRVPPIRFVRGFLTPMDWGKLTLAVGGLAEVPFFFDFAIEYTELELAKCVVKVKGQNQLGLVVVDGVEHLTSSWNHATRHAEIRTIVKALRKIALDNEVPIVLTAATALKDDQRMDDRPLIMDLGDWEPLASDAANIVLILYRSRDYYIHGPDKGITNVHVAKNAYGHTGIVQLAYRDRMCTFENLEEE